MKHLSRALSRLAAAALLSGTLIDCCNCNQTDEGIEAHSDPTNPIFWQGELDAEKEVVLFAACATEDPVIVSGYINGGGDPNRMLLRSCERPGFRPVLLAAFFNSLLVVRQLLFSGANAYSEASSNADEPEKGESVLCAAVRGAAFETVQYLLQNVPIDRNSKDENGLTALAYSVLDPGGMIGILHQKVKDQLRTLMSGESRNDRLIEACIDFVLLTRTCDLRHIVQHEQDAKQVFSLVRNAMEESLRPGENANFYKEVLENGCKIGRLRSMFKQPPDYGTQVLQLLLDDPDVDLTTVDRHGNTVIHLAAQRVINGRKISSRDFAFAVKRLQTLIDNARVKREINFAATNSAGASVQQNIDDALQYAAARARAEEAEARLAGTRNKILFACSAAVVLGMGIGCYFIPSVRQYIVQQRNKVAGLLGKAWGACGGQATLGLLCDVLNTCSRQVSRWRRNALKDQMW